MCLALTSVPIEKWTGHWVSGEAITTQGGKRRDKNFYVGRITNFTLDDAESIGDINVIVAISWLGGGFIEPYYLVTKARRLNTLYF